MVSLLPPLPAHTIVDHLVQAMPQLCSEAPNGSVPLWVQVKLLSWPIRPNTIRTPKPFRCHLLLLFCQLPQLQPHCPLCCSSNKPGVLLPQGLSACWSLCLECFSLTIHMTHSLTFLSHFLKKTTSQWSLLQTLLLKTVLLNFLIHVALL